MSTPAVELVGLTKSFGSVTAVDDLDLRIENGEFFSMLGPSGSGKTTVLRMIAGFEQPTAGRVLLDGDDVTARPPFARDVNTVFQDYALFPHMDVLDNVEYGLRVKKVPAVAASGPRDGGSRVRAARTATPPPADPALRRPAPARGPRAGAGQPAQGAAARRAPRRPGPQAAPEMQLELKQLQREVGITFVFVTHDQEEALTMSDRIAVFSDGRIEQVATPAELYENPSTAFVAGFVGTSNLLTGEAAPAVLGREGTFSIRPEKIHLDSDVESGNTTARGHRGRRRLPRLGQPLPRRARRRRRPSRCCSRTSGTARTRR